MEMYTFYFEFLGIKLHQETVDTAKLSLDPILLLINKLTTTQDPP